ncbi:MAG: tRNA (adenosine(37)-N6)-threonylcarbamoyltransferase complex ATPase subunit type 1 TsaE [Candidatus Binatia bacterium]
MRFDLATGSPGETLAAAGRIGSELRGGERIALVGELGAGKTAFVRGLARGLAIDPNVVYSPTFTLIAEHPGPIPLRHIDLYRLRQPVGFAEAEEIGLFEALEGPVVGAIEWFDRCEPALASAIAPALRVEITIPAGGGRHLGFEAFDARGEAAIARLRCR